MNPKRERPKGNDMLEEVNWKIVMVMCTLLCFDYGNFNAVCGSL